MTLVSLRHFANLAGEAAGPEPCGEVFMKNTRRSGSGNGTGLSSTASTTEKIAMLTPMPSANADTAASEKLGLRHSVRSASLISAIRVSTDPPGRMRRLDTLDARNAGLD